MVDKKNKNISTRQSAISTVVILLIVLSIVYAGFSSSDGVMEAVNTAGINSAKSAVNLAIGLIGMMSLWLGLMKILEVGGFMQTIAKAIKPIMIKLFPDVPPEHPSMGAMILNVSANALGLGNAATPFGLKAMEQLSKINPFPKEATNAMCLFLAINTSSVTILPLGVIAVRAAAGCSDPAGIFLPTFLSTLVSTIVAISVATFFAKSDTKYSERVVQAKGDSPTDIAGDTVSSDYNEMEQDFSHLKIENPPSYLKYLSLFAFFLFFVSVINKLYQKGLEDGLVFLKGEFLSAWLLPFLMLSIVLYGLSKGVKIYETIIDGAKQGFEIATKIIPFLVVILVAIAMFRASGLLDLFTSFLNPLTMHIGLPAEVLPMAITRPLSGSGAFGVMSSIINDDPDSYSSFLASVMMGSTETTFYVIAVYFGSIGILSARHAFISAISADIAGIFAACFFSSLFY